MNIQRLLLFVLAVSVTAKMEAQNTFPSSGNVGIGTTSPGAKLSFTNIDATNLNDGITWYSPAPLDYGIYRTAGGWASPNYQQLKIHFETGIILSPGSLHAKSFVDIQGGGLRVSSGNVGIGTLNPNAPLHVKGSGYGSHITIETNSSGHGDLQWFQGGTAPANQRAAFQVNENNGNFEGWAYGSSDWLKWLTVNRNNGNVGIGTTNPNQKLTVNGTIYGKEVKVDLSVPGPDYVFHKDYKLTSLEDIKTYIDQHKHLPEVPSAVAMEANGINLSEMNMLLLKKVEELTLHLIELKNEVTELRNHKK